MTDNWSDNLINETREVLDLGFVPRDDFVHMKNINGDFGKIGIADWFDRKLIIQDKRSDAIYKYNTVEELITAGWAVD